MKVERFEDLRAWQKARELTNEVYRLSRNGRMDHGLKDQMQRAAVSVMANVAEGFERGSREELVQFLYIARASCGEVRSHLYVASDQGFIDAGEFQRVSALASHVSSLIYRFIESLKTSGIRGQKFKVPPRKTQREEWIEFMKEFEAKEKALKHESDSVKPVSQEPVT